MPYYSLLLRMIIRYKVLLLNGTRRQKAKYENFAIKTSRLVSFAILKHEFFKNYANVNAVKTEHSRKHIGRTPYVIISIFFKYTFCG